MAYFTHQKIINLTWNRSGPIITQVRAYVGLMDNMCGVVQALKIMLRGGCGPPQDNEVRCGCGPSLCGAVWVRVGVDAGLAFQTAKISIKDTIFLGIYVDENINWGQHIEHCRKTLSSGLYPMNAAKRTLGTYHFRILYFCLIHPCISYGNVLCGNSFQNHIRKIETLQKKAIRIITRSSYDEYTTISAHGYLKLADIHDLSIYLFINNFVHHIVPRPLTTMFKYHSEVHGHATRHSDDPRIPIVPTVRRSMNYRGPYMWMNLDDKLKKISSNNSFKCQMKKLTIVEY